MRLLAQKRSFVEIMGIKFTPPQNRTDTMAISVWICIFPIGIGTQAQRFNISPLRGFAVIGWKIDRLLIRKQWAGVYDCIYGLSIINAVVETLN